MYTVFYYARRAGGPKHELRMRNSEFMHKKIRRSLGPLLAISLCPFKPGTPVML
ncbi:unnamed protein product [Acanthoscelides obtectus]|uniref:Uncharacterized protein n=1 Tax=Acanthoscelides obtectus TaxID=200917 RepID=A0A9P0LVI4_ACAOB|nr:unnamed protein product [Acanthoscelides obtectus]CAK1644082.1 hypothetical protein AOBTE_LOCUS13817 [Acanthoscelides obtectus]